MQTSESIKNLSEALVSFHKEVGKISKDSKNPFFKSKYASLSNILETIHDSLINNGLTVVQFPEGENGLTTRLCHSSGEWMEATYSMRPAKDDPQGRGSAITYQRRYAIGAILSLNIDEDDDGNNASKPSQKASTPAPKNDALKHDNKNVPTSGEKQDLCDLMEKSTLNPATRAAVFNKISNCNDYTIYNEIKYYLENNQPSIDQIPNPSQKDINNHVKKIA
jgi:hypothetical protein